jgi:tetratricopeptide (TPR) repeat protein
MRGRADDWATASIEAHRHRRLAGRSSMPPPDLGAALLSGSRPADEVLAILDRQLAETPSVWLQLNRAWALAMLDRVEEGRQLAHAANARLREQDDARWGEWMLAEISTLGGDHEDASNRLHTLCEWLEAMEQLTFLANYLGRLGRSLCKLGRFDDAERAAVRARSLEETWGGSMPDYLWREVMARVHAHRGDLVEAERLAREAVQASELTDSLDDQCQVLCDLAEVLATAGQLDEATAALAQALAGCLRKQNLAFARQVRQRLEELRADEQKSRLTSMA